MDDNVCKYRDIFTFSGAIAYLFYDVSFMKDFGMIKKGQIFERVSVDFENGSMECDDGVEVYTINFELVPV